MNKQPMSTEEQELRIRLALLDMHQRRGPGPLSTESLERTINGVFACALKAYIPAVVGVFTFFGVLELIYGVQVPRLSGPVDETTFQYLIICFWMVIFMFRMH
jgi:hypothetical protein